LDRAGPEHRHRTLEAAFAWTWDLLDRDERAVLSGLAALPRTFDLELAEAVTEPGAASVVLQLLDRSLVSPAATPERPRRFRLLSALRAFVRERTSADVAEGVLRAHAGFYAEAAGALADRARSDDSAAAAAASLRLRPEAVAALDWAIEHAPEVAACLARAIAVLCEQYGPDIESLDALDRAARDPGLRACATVRQLLDLGITLAYGDLTLLTELASLALARADDEDSRLCAHHIAGYAAAYRHDGAIALEELAVAERLADERLAVWQLASIRQARGIALRGPDLADLGGAMAAFESSMRTYALAGDAMHVSNARYMMAAVAAESGERVEQAVGWAEECAEYARESGNRHELAHALLTHAALSDDPRAEAEEAAEIFQAVGDLRCMTRSYQLLARGRAPLEQIPQLESALGVATRANDRAAQIAVLESLIAARWRAGRRHEAAVALGGLVGLSGYDAALARSPSALRDDVEAWSAAIAEGEARMHAMLQATRDANDTELTGQSNS
jgi:hypothetical protein